MMNRVSRKDYMIKALRNRGIDVGKDGRLSYNGGLSVLLFDPERAMFLGEEFLAHYICEEPVKDIHLI